MYSTTKKLTQEIIAKRLSKIHPEISLKPGTTYYWSPGDRTVYYNKENNTVEGIWALLHESGHAMLEHKKYFSDIELVRIEVEAWEKAKAIAREVKLVMDEDHIQDCLDSYRDWLHRRSLCPDCNLAGIQINTKEYSCIFCQHKWTVSTERFCRPYRRKTK